MDEPKHGDSPSRLSDIFNRIGVDYQSYLAKRLAASHCLTGPDERRARMDAIIELSAELERIKSIQFFATLLFRGPIEAIILGDWDMAASYLALLTFEDEVEEIRVTYAPLWARFREILECAVIAARVRQGKNTAGQA